VTTCIAAICHKERKIVTASDFLLTIPGKIQFQAALPKLTMISPSGRWFSLFSNKDSEAEAIWMDVRDRLAHQPDEKWLTVTNAFKDACRHRIDERAEAETFWDTKCLNAIEKEGKHTGWIKRLRRDIGQKQSRVELDVRFILAGFDSNDEPRLFLVEHPGKIEPITPRGFGAIGTGGELASVSLGLVFPRKQVHRIVELEELVYRVCCAKFDSESAPDVDTATFVTVHNIAGNWECLSDETITNVRRAWEDSKMTPAAMEDIIKGGFVKPVCGGL